MHTDGHRCEVNDMRFMTINFWLNFPVSTSHMYTCKWWMRKIAWLQPYEVVSVWLVHHQFSMPSTKWDFYRYLPSKRFHFFLMSDNNFTSIFIWKSIEVGFLYVNIQIASSFTNGVCWRNVESFPLVKWRELFCRMHHMVVAHGKQRHETHISIAQNSVMVLIIYFSHNFGTIILWKV